MKMPLPSEGETSLPSHTNDDGELSKKDFRIAIIGASYSGLTFANTILHDPTITYTIFDAMPAQDERSCYIVGGDFEVPSCQFILAKLGLLRDIDKSAFTIDREGLYKVLFDGIVQSRRKNNNNEEKYDNDKRRIFEYQQRIVEIFPKPTSDMSKDEEKLYCKSKGGTTFGPYDLIIGADGVLSTCRRQWCHRIYSKSNPKTKRLLLIGDARWVQNYWWDFGKSRIKEGADVALRDGFELGTLILSTRNERNTTCKDNMHSSKEASCGKYIINNCFGKVHVLEDNASFDKFCARKIQKNIQRRNVLMIVIIICVATMRIFWLHSDHVII